MIRLIVAIALVSLVMLMNGCAPDPPRPALPDGQHRVPVNRVPVDPASPMPAPVMPAPAGGSDEQ